MSLPATKYWFTFSGRRNRKSYILAFLLLIAIQTLAIGLMYVLYYTTGTDSRYRSLSELLDLFALSEYYPIVLVTAFCCSQLSSRSFQ